MTFPALKDPKQMTMLSPISTVRLDGKKEGRDYPRPEEKLAKFSSGAVGETGLAGSRQDRNGRGKRPFRLRRTGSPRDAG